MDRNSLEQNRGNENEASLLFHGRLSLSHFAMLFSIILPVFPYCKTAW